jgi:hypothetical protein
LTQLEELRELEAQQGSSQNLVQTKVSKKTEGNQKPVEIEKTEDPLPQVKKPAVSELKPKNLEGWLWRKSLNILHGYQVYCR